MWLPRGAVAAAGAAAAGGWPLLSKGGFGLGLSVWILGIDAQFPGAVDAREVPVVSGEKAEEQPALPGGEGKGCADGVGGGEANGFGDVFGRYLRHADEDVVEAVDHPGVAV